MCESRLSLFLIYNYIQVSEAKVQLENTYIDIGMNYFLNKFVKFVVLALQHTVREETLKLNTYLQAFRRGLDGGKSVASVV